MLNEYIATISYTKNNNAFIFTRPGVRVKAHDVFQAQAQVITNLAKEQGEIRVVDASVVQVKIKRFYVKVSFSFDDSLLTYFNTYNFFVDSRREAEKRAVEMTKSIYGDNVIASVIETTEYSI